MRNYSFPLLLAVALHGLVGLGLYAGWDANPTPPVLVKPKIVTAELIQLKAKFKPVKKTAPPETKVAPAIVAEKIPAPNALEKKKIPDPKLLAKREAERKAEQERAERLRALVAKSFELALNDESSEIVENENDEIAKSYIQGIYELIVANWSRPPSARNGMRVVLQVNLIPTGDVAQVVVTESSGNVAFDRSAEAAVRKAGKFEVPQESHIFEENFRSFPVIFKPEDLLR